MKLKHVLMLAMVLLTATPLFFSLHYLNSFANDQYRLQFGEKLSALSLIAQKRLLGVVDRINDNTALIASRTQMRISLGQWNNTPVRVHQQKIRRIILDAKQGISRLQAIDIYDLSGQPVVSTQTTPVAALNLAQHSDAGISLESGDSQLLLSKLKPLTLHGKPIGYLKAVFKVDFLSDLLQDRAGLGETGEWVIAVGHDSGAAQYIVPIDEQSQAVMIRRVVKEHIDLPMTQALQGNEVVMYKTTDYRGVPVLASTRFIPELDWGLVVTVSEQEVNQLIKSADPVIYLAEGLIIIVAALVGVGLAWRISQPVENLIAHTQEVAKGQFIECPPIGGWREIQALADHFNFMIRALRDLNDNLNLKVRERTRLLNQANQQLQEMASRDPLTGLYNRRYLHERLDQEISRCNRYDAHMALVMIDIDHFKTINDSWGHAVGDQVLTQLSDFLKDSLRESDILARIGGEEFCLVLPSSSADSSLAFVERLRHDISQQHFQAGEKPFQVTCSFGVAYLDNNIHRQEDLMQKADQALYAAKESGRNLVLQYSSSEC